MRYLLFATFTLSTIGLFSPNAIADDPVLIKATFFSHTNDEDKDHDTGIYVRVTAADGTTTIAHADNRDNSGDDATQYKDGSDHQFDLDLDSPGLSKPTCQKYTVHMYIHTHGKDTWHFNGRVVLYFSDKTNITATLGNSELKNDGAATDFNAP